MYLKKTKKLIFIIFMLTSFFTITPMIKKFVKNVRLGILSLCENDWELVEEAIKHEHHKTFKKWLNGRVKSCFLHACCYVSFRESTVYYAGRIELIRKNFVKLQELGLLPEDAWRKFVSTPGAFNKKSETPLMIACQYSSRQLEFIKSLLEWGADPNIPDSEGKTPLWWVCHHRDIELARLLLENGAHISLEHINQGLDFTFFKSPLLWVCSGGVYKENTSVSKLLLEHLLLQDKVEIKKGADGKYTQETLYHMVRLLIQLGDNINVSAKCGGTPLWQACQNSFTQIVELLLDNEAQITRDDIYGLLISYVFEYCRNGIVKLFLERGIQPIDGFFELCKHRVSPLWWACQKNDIELVEWLLKRGAAKCINISCRESSCENYTTPFELAIRNNNTNIVRLLLKTGVYIPVNKKVAKYDYWDEDKVAPLSWACKHGYAEVVKLLLMRSAECGGVLRKACKKKDFDIVRMLVENISTEKGQGVYRGVAYGSTQEIKDYIGSIRDFERSLDKFQYLKKIITTEKKESKDLVRYIFCKTVYALVKSQNTLKKTVFYKIYKLTQEDGKIIDIIKKTFGVGVINKDYKKVISEIIRKCVLCDGVIVLPGSHVNKALKKISTGTIQYTDDQERTSFVKNNLELGKKQKLIIQMKDSMPVVVSKVFLFCG